MITMAGFTIAPPPSDDVAAAVSSEVADADYTLSALSGDPRGTHIQRTCSLAESVPSAAAELVASSVAELDASSVMVLVADVVAVPLSVIVVVSVSLAVPFAATGVASSLLFLVST